MLFRHCYRWKIYYANETNLMCKDTVSRLQPPSPPPLASQTVWPAKGFAMTVQRTMLGSWCMPRKERQIMSWKSWSRQHVHRDPQKISRFARTQLYILDGESMANDTCRLTLVFFYLKKRAKIIGPAAVGPVPPSLHAGRVCKISSQLIILFIDTLCVPSL
jgi:hypothetical protein